MSASITPEQLVAAVRSLVGTRWLHRGRRATGVDCIGMVTLAMAHAGVDPVAQLGFLDSRDYSGQPSATLMEQVRHYCSPAVGLVTGALLVFQFPNDEHPRHFAIYTAQKTMIHANVRVGKVVEHGYRMHWVRWTHSFWKLPGVDYAI